MTSPLEKTDPEIGLEESRDSTAARPAPHANPTVDVEPK